MGKELFVCDFHNLCFGTKECYGTNSNLPRGLGGKMIDLDVFV
jgi:hypothetical protein